MSNRKTTEERIITLDKKMEPLREKLDQLEKQKEALESAKKEADRKARTHRLIQLGGTIAKFLGREMTDDDVGYLEEYLKWEGSHTNYFTRAMNRKPAEKKEVSEQAGTKDAIGKKEPVASAKAKTAASEKSSAGTGVPKPTTNP